MTVNISGSVCFGVQGILYICISLTGDVCVCCRSYECESMDQEDTGVRGRLLLCLQVKPTLLVITLLVLRSGGFWNHHFISLLVVVASVVDIAVVLSCTHYVYISCLD